MYSSPSYKKNRNLALAPVKYGILKYLHHKINTKGARHERIKTEDDLNYIRDNAYIICPRYFGTRSWIIFCKLADVYYAVSFPKYQKYIAKNLIIHPINVGVTKDFYCGTIMEGIFYKINVSRYLVIDEIYLLAGQNQLLKSKDDRLNDLSQYITTNTLYNETYQIYVSQYYSLDKKNLMDLYEKIKTDKKIKEIIFYPKNYGKKIYDYVVDDPDRIDDIIKLTTLRMQKTNSPDVYNLFPLNSDQKMGIAYIPNMEISKKCKSWFVNSKKKEFRVKCQMHLEKKKWIPISIEDDTDDTDSESV